MSLDVALYDKSYVPVEKEGEIFIRNNGQTKKITHKEWDELFPDRKPFMVLRKTEDEEVFTANITHNLGRMAAEAGIYQACWRPEEIWAENAKDIIPILEEGLAILKMRPDYFKKFDAPNGWGTYEVFVPWVEGYLEACKEHPHARIEVSR